MNKLVTILTSAVAGVLLSANSLAQVNCYTDQHTRELEMSNPQMIADKIQFDQEFKQFLQNYDLEQAKGYGKNSGPAYIIPVVVHVFHNYGAERISEAQILNEINFLNLSFNRLNADTGNTRPIFRDVAGNARVQFRLARKDPRGNPTNGIVYHYTPLTNKADDNIKRLSVWDSQRYLNIWICQRINRQIQNGIIAGYAQFPFGMGAGNVAATDGIIINYQYVGNTGAALPPSSPFQTTVTHEIGHWLGLYHPFQGDTCELENDGCSDTPPRNYNFETSGTPNFCNNPNSNTCSSDNPDLPDQYENYMDYFGGSCSNNMFTAQQVARMHFCLNNYRRLLWSQENLEFTGVADISGPNNTPPIASFDMINNNNLTAVRVCVGNQVQFRDNSYNGQITQWQWDFGAGATPATHTGQLPPAVTYSTNGKKTITLTVTGPNGTNTLTRTDYLTVDGPSDGRPAHQLSADWDYQNNFQDLGWYFENEAPVNPWSRVTNAAYDEIASVRLNSRQASSTFNYSLISPSYNLTGASNPYFEFYYSFAPNLSSIRSGTGTTTGDSQDGLTLFVSTDCGRTWVQRGFLGGNPSSSNPPVANPMSTLPINPTNNNATGVQNSVIFVPSGPGQWRQFIVQGTNNIPAQDNIRFKINVNYQGGNNFYIDRIRVGVSSSVNDLSKSDLAFRAYPNPFTETTTINYTLPESSRVNIKLYDIMGREVAELLNSNQQAGQQELTVNKNEYNLTKGVYIVKFNIDGASGISHKLIVE
jgi:PKD repeat protein